MPCCHAAIVAIAVIAAMVTFCTKDYSEKKLTNVFLHLINGQNSNVCFIKGLHMHKNFIWKLFEHLRHIQSVQDSCVNCNLLYCITPLIY